MFERILQRVERAARRFHFGDNWRWAWGTNSKAVNRDSGRERV